YFPGYLSGGIARTIFNTAEWLGHEIEFLIVTRDRDLGSEQPYAGVQRGMWVTMGNSKVRYLEPDELTLFSLAKIVNKTEHDVLHLNSFFDSVFSIKLLLLCRLRWIKSRQVILAPRGEFVAGPLSIKYSKKKIYIELSRFFGFYKGVKWHASSPHEAQGIVNAMRMPAATVNSAIDLPVKNSVALRIQLPVGNELKVVFLSRLTREKNLDGALRILQRVHQSMQFDIVGPKEDHAYWQECEALLIRLPPHVTARYLGPIPPEKVFDCLSKYDLFFLPSHGENYGHVIAESIAVGTRVLISQATPWRNLDEDGIGWDLDLTDHTAFANVLDEQAVLPSKDRVALRESVRRAAVKRLFNPMALDQNRLLYSLI
ncbi:MAG: glycosyltransferase, partial [Glaciimonas sp.]|nr:glycosyltransferase [Glaciimonas sp.]